MEEKLMRLSEEGNISSLTQTLAGIKDEKVVEMLEKFALSERNDSVGFLKAILKGSPCSTGDGQKRTLHIYKCCIQLLNNGELSNKVATEIVGNLLMELDSLPGKALAELADVFLDAIKEGSISGKLVNCARVQTLKL
ncbi:Fanconi anemia group I protein-like [Exaiptasia diaphana]|nr:Fanconi anemia group I protein-like [Exaiptasia diaphana]